ncbi:hypothetical protein AGMMS49959_13940 [Planctomycetales bacterium]|nr:hypothetical protein AGMMS49959_13940 [Planctomycetales bacterium]
MLRIRSDDSTMTMTAMIDVIFLLVIFFVCASAVTDASHAGVALPLAKNGESQNTERFIINVMAEDRQKYSRDGEVRVMGQTLNDAELQQILKEQSELGERDANGYSNRVVIIRADQRATYESVRRVVNICRENRLWRIAYSALHLNEETGGK